MLRISFKTLGCRLNQAETAQFAASFECRGFTVVPYGNACEVCVIHGCAVTRLAERQSLRQARAAKALPGKPFVVLSGCAAEMKSHDGLEDSGADLTVGQADKEKLADLVLESLSSHTSSLSTIHHKQSAIHYPLFLHRAFLKIQDGCDFRCAYCIVPSLRGDPVSRPLADILREAETTISAGFKELVLSGVNLGLWREGGRTLPHLLEKLCALPGLGRIRLSSIEVSTVERDVIAFMAGNPRLCSYLHLPLQSGDDRILASMGRRYTAAQFRATVEEAVGRIPDIGLGADVIAGFPGEDEAAFASTLNLLESLPFSNIHAFPYSRRPGTRAADMTNMVPQSVRKSRVAELLALKMRKREQFATAFLGKDVEVLIEGKGNAAVGIGWTAEYLQARVQGAPTPGSLVRMRVTKVEGDVLEGSSA
jgi:threonylcarbamoyladenosine tRNA methylthiotransferase MtaB